MSAGEWIAVAGIVVPVVGSALASLIWSVRTMDRITGRLEAMERRDGEHDARIERLEGKVFGVPALAGG